MAEYIPKESPDITSSSTDSKAHPRQPLVLLDRKPQDDVTHAIQAVSEKTVHPTDQSAMG
jgi:hypothetical protein